MTGGSENGIKLINTADLIYSISNEFNMPKLQGSNGEMHLLGTCNLMILIVFTFMTLKLMSTF